MHSKQFPIQDKKVLGIAVVLVVIIIAVAAWVIMDNGGQTEEGPIDDLVVQGDQTISGDETINGDLIVESGGSLKVTNGAVITMTSKDAKVDVDGILDLREGTIRFVTVAEDGTMTVLMDNSDGGDRSITSSGTIHITQENVAHQSGIREIESGVYKFINSALYTDSDDNVVITSVSAAASGVPDGGEVTVLGTFAEKGTGTLDGSSRIVVDASATVTFGTLNLSSATVQVNGRASGTIACGDGAVVLAGVTGLDATTAEIGDATRLILSGEPDGDITVSSGTVDTGVLKIDGITMTVAEGATLEVPSGEGRYFEVGVGPEDSSAALIVRGTLAVNGGDLRDYYDDVTDENRQIIDIFGTMTVPAGSEVNIEGSLNITPEGKVSVIGTLGTKGDGSISSKGIIEVGTTPTMLSSASASKQGTLTGNIATSGTGYVKVYYTANQFNGSDGWKSTVFNIDSIAYMTVYTKTDVSINGILTKENFVLEKLDAAKLSNVSNWYSSAELQGTGLTTTSNVSGNAQVYYKSDVKIFEIDVNVQAGVSLTIDGQSVGSGKVHLSAGEHTLIATPDDGKSYTIAISFGEKQVTDGKIVVEDGSATTIAVTATPNEPEPEPDPENPGEDGDQDAEESTENPPKDDTETEQ